MKLTFSSPCLRKLLGRTKVFFHEPMATKSSAPVVSICGFNWTRGMYESSAALNERLAKKAFMLEW